MHECKYDKEIKQMEIDIAVAKSDIQQVKTDISDLKTSIKKIGSDMESARTWLISILLAILGTFVLDKFF